MLRYKNTQPVRVRIPDAGVEVDPGEEFDSEVELNNPTLVRVDKKKVPASAAEQEDKP